MRVFPNLNKKLQLNHGNTLTAPTPRRPFIIPLSSLIPASSFTNISGLATTKQRWRWERAASQSAKKPPLFMKIYNFAGEVYDSAGMRIGRRRSCGHGGMGTYFPWGYIAAAVFGVAHSLNSCNTNPFLAPFLRLLDVRHFAPLHPAPPPPLPPPLSSPKNMESPRCDGAVRAELMCRLMCVKMRDGRTRGRWDYLGQNHLNKNGGFFSPSLPPAVGSWRTGRRRALLRRSGSRAGMMDYQQR